MLCSSEFPFRGVWDVNRVAIKRALGMMESRIAIVWSTKIYSLALSAKEIVQTENLNLNLVGTGGSCV